MGNNSHYIIGIDIGTSSTKAVLFDQTGRTIGKSSRAYALYSPVADAAEQNPVEIFAAVVQTVHHVVTECAIAPEEILALSFSAAMHSLLAVDVHGESLTPVLTWADNRSMTWAEEIRRSPQRQALYQRTGTPIHAMSPLTKIVWLRQERPAIFARTHKFIGIKEYVLYQLFHYFVVDYAIASATGLLNLTTLEWDEVALSVAGITPDQLPQLAPPTQILQPLNPEIAHAMGVLPTTPVVIGGGDGALSNLGLGAIAPGTVAITIGTSGAIRTLLKHPQTDPQERLFCYVFTADLWILGGAVNNGGIVLQWLRDQLALATSYDQLMEMAETIPAGAEGLLFHPYLLGERSPLWNAEARGSFFGLTLKHDRAHLVRAVLEGIVLNLHQVFQVLQSVAGSAERIKVAGGFTASPLGRQILADVFNREIWVPDQRESSSLGAAILGLYALGIITSLDCPTELAEPMYTHTPIPENVAIYQQLIPLYQRLLETFQENYSLIAHKPQSPLSTTETPLA